MPSPAVPAAVQPPAVGETVAPASSGAALDGLRQEIDEVDRHIVALLARRQEAVARVAQLKAQAQLPIYHPAREENLISQRREQASRAGLDPNFVEELYRCIVRQSRVRQRVQVAQSSEKGDHPVLIVGGRGEMGRYFARWFEKSGYEVRVLGADDWAQAAVLTRGARLALICVPNHLTSEVARRLGPQLPQNCVLADISSVKCEPLTAMLAAHAGPVMGLHPLFGPSTSSMDKQVVAMTPGRDSEGCRWVLEQLAAWGNIVLPLAAEEHDQVMDLVQGVHHFATFALARFLARRQVDLGRTLELSSPIYRVELGMVGRLFAQDAQLYSNIVFASPERRALLREYLDSVLENRQMIEAGDEAQFAREFQQIAAWFGPFSEQALRESSFMIEKLVERF